jgi:hypothetical protein
MIVRLHHTNIVSEREREREARRGPAAPRLVIMHDSEKLAVRDGPTTVRGMILMAHVERYSSEKLAVPLPPSSLDAISRNWQGDSIAMMVLHFWYTLIDRTTVWPKSQVPQQPRRCHL